MARTLACRVVTVFFSDIMGFTAISEQLTAAAMVNLLNHYFDAVTRCIRADNGIVDKYIGDAVMAFWSPPFSPGDSHAAAACLAALTQQEAIRILQADLPNIIGLRRNAPNLLVRMGIGTGEVVVGTIGSPVSKSFTVIGDTVNLASRLEGINKVYGTRVIIAEDTLRLAQVEVEARELDLITVAGKTEPVRIYELLSPFGKLDPDDATCRRMTNCSPGRVIIFARSWTAKSPSWSTPCIFKGSRGSPQRRSATRASIAMAIPPPRSSLSARLR
jgi:adenylate cyclase